MSNSVKEAMVEAARVKTIKEKKTGCGMMIFHSFLICQMAAKKISGRENSVGN